MAHEANLSKREQFRLIEGFLQPYFDNYDGNRSAFLRAVAAASGLTPQVVEQTLEGFLDDSLKSELDRQVFRQTGPWMLAEIAVWGPEGHYSDDN